MIGFHEMIIPFSGYCILTARFLLPHIFFFLTFVYVTSTHINSCFIAVISSFISLRLLMIWGVFFFLQCICFLQIAFFCFLWFLQYKVETSSGAWSFLAACSVLRWEMSGASIVVKRVKLLLVMLASCMDTGLYAGLFHFCSNSLLLA